MRITYNILSRLYAIQSHATTTQTNDIIAQKRIDRVAKLLEEVIKEIDDDAKKS